jgi:hypothetical protein
VRLLHLEKIGLGIARIVLMLQGRGAAPTFAAGSTGWIWAFLFIAAYFKTESDRAAP